MYFNNNDRVYLSLPVQPAVARGPRPPPQPCGGSTASAQLTDRENAADMPPKELARLFWRLFTKRSERTRLCVCTVRAMRAR